MTEEKNIDSERLNEMANYPRETIIMGNMEIAATTGVSKDLNGVQYAALVLYRLSEPSKTDEVEDWNKAKYCSAMILFKDRRSIAVMREWCNSIEERLNEIEKGVSD